MDWQPIDTAPKGEHIIGAWQDTMVKNPHVEGVYFEEGAWWYSHDGDGPARPPTHWMPIPALLVPNGVRGGE